MIQQELRLKITDNMGAEETLTVRVFGGSPRHYVGIGDTIVATVRDAIPDGSVKKGDIVKTVVVRIRKETHRADGSYIRFDENAAIVIDTNDEPHGAHIFGSVGRELRGKKFIRTVSLVPEVI